MNAATQPCRGYPAHRLTGSSAGSGTMFEQQPRRRFLCATDLSARSQRAVQRAAILARQAGADLMLVHAVDERHPERLVRMMAERAATELRAQFEDIGLPRTSVGGIAVRVGRPMQVLRDAAHEWEADLIVAAAPARRDYDRVFGTTGERLVRALELPVLFVHRAPRGAYTKVVVATDLSDGDVRMARTSALLRVFEAAHTTIMHACGPSYDGVMSMVGIRQAQVAAYARQWKSRLCRELARHAAAAGICPSQVSVVQESARPFVAIQRIVRQTEPDLLAIGTSRYFMLKRMLLGSVADEVLRKIDCDILVISPAAAARPQFRLRRLSALAGAATQDAGTRDAALLN